LCNSRHFNLVKTAIRSAVGKEYDRFQPNTFVKRMYYRTFMQFAERVGRGDQLIVVVQKQ
jgi:hypothetical protein